MKEGFKKNLILNIIIIVLSVMLFLLTVTFLIETVDYQRSYKVTEGDMINYVRYQEYDVLVECMYSNEANGIKPTGDMEELYAVALYYENAVLYTPSLYFLRCTTSHAAKLGSVLLTPSSELCSA